MREPHAFELAENGHSGRSGRVRPEERLAAWGKRQHRLVTTAQLRAVGWDGSLVSKRVDAGRLHPVFAEVHSLGGEPRTDKELWMASVLTYGRGTALGASAAAELYDLLRYPLKELHVVTLRHRKPRDGIVPHAHTDGYPWRFVDGIPVTSPEQTILDCATTVTNPKAYRRIVRTAQAEQLTSHAKLLAFAARNPGKRGVARLRRELAEGPSRTRSANEDEVLDVFRQGGVPEANAIVHGDEVDLWFPKLAVAVEVQSALHENPTAQANDLAKRNGSKGAGCACCGSARAAGLEPRDELVEPQLLEPAADGLELRRAVLDQDAALAAQLQRLAQAGLAGVQPADDLLDAGGGGLVGHRRRGARLLADRLGRNQAHGRTCTVPSWKRTVISSSVRASSADVTGSSPGPETSA